MFVGAEVFPGGEDGTGGHGLHPEAFDGFLDFSDFDDVAEDEFAFATGVAGIDDEVDVFAFGEFEDLFEAWFGIGDGVEVEGFGDGGEDVEFPGEFFAVGAHGHAEFDEVTDGGGDDGAVVFVPDVTAFALFFEFAEGFGEGLGEVVHDGGFFGDDEYFSHGCW